MSLFSKVIPHQLEVCFGIQNYLKFSFLVAGITLLEYGMSSELLRVFHTFYHLEGFCIR